MFTLLFARRHSYGVIPLRQTERGIEILLIDQKDSSRVSGGAYWTFPKGTPEKGETGRETAVRETREETGITCTTIDPSFAYDETYSFTVGLTRYDKIVTYYIGRADSSKVTMQEKEVKDHVWLPLSDARMKLTHDNARSIIDAITARLPHSRLFEG